MQVPVRTEVNINVGKRMRILRKSAHLTQHDVAEQVGVSFQQMQKYEKGESVLVWNCCGEWHISIACR